jgi:hypothetical protein
LKQRPVRAWVQVAADNRSRVFVNGKEAGQSEDWRRPASFEVTALLRDGENLIAVDGYNEDGPAGVVLSLNGWSETGRATLEVKSDATWKAFDSQAEHWHDVTFDDSSWLGARVIAPIGGGIWEDKVRSDYTSDEYVASISRSDHPSIAGLDGAIGRLVLLDALRAGPACKTILTADQIPIALAGEGAAGRVVLMAGFPQRITPRADSPDVLANLNFRRFILKSVAWLARTSAPDRVSGDLQPATPTSPLHIDPLKPEDRDRFFPVAMQFTPLPHDGLPPPDSFPTRQSALRRQIDNMIDHGMTTLHCPVQLPADQAHDVENYAQSRGMTIAYWWFEHPAEVFNRKEPPPVSLYSKQYSELVRKRIDENRQKIARYPRLLTVWTFQDEPFHHGHKSFSFDDTMQAEFAKRFGEKLPADLDAAKTNPKTWLDFLNLQSDYWPVGWRQTYKLVKQANPNFIAAMNHDSHNTFGGSVQQEGPINVDDVFHWGGDWADMYSFDIYPYLMLDFRYGPNRKIKLPRMAQTHFAFAQMRNLTTTFGKKLGFWVGTYNPEWYDLPKEGHEQYWMEREMAYTAVANGADFLIGGIGIPIDQHHWDDFGQSMRVLAKVGAQVLKAPKIRARAAMLFPRTQMLVLQEEYWNVAQSYEAFLRAFGELDVIHEDQLAGDTLNHYDALLLFDVKLLPRAAAEKISAFVRRGGTVIADCVPSLDESRQPLNTMNQLFGVKDAVTNRVLWKIVKKKDDPDAVEDTPESASPRPSDGVKNVPIVSARPCAPDGAQVLLSTDNGKPALLKAQNGSGRAYLLGFCLQDTMFEAFRANDVSARRQLLDMLRQITDEARLRSHVWSSNPEIEAAVRANQSEGFVFVVSHEAANSAAKIRLADLPFEIARVRDVETDHEVPFTRDGNAIELNVTAPNGASQILHLTPR